MTLEEVVASALKSAEDLQAGMGMKKAVSVLTKKNKVLEARCAHMSGWLQGIVDYKCVEVCKDAFAYNRLLNNIKNAARQGLGLPRVSIEMDEDSDRELVNEMLEALEELVNINEQHNEDVCSIIGRPLGWSDSYLDKARSVIEKARGQ